MDEITNYRTASAETLNLLDQAVNKLINEGWQPFGNPYVSTKTNDFHVCQGMVKAKTSIKVEEFDPEAFRKIRP